MSRAWTRLDNAAKIFPPNTSLRDSKVFRFACELTESVEPALLKEALEETLREFPLFQSVLKRGLFWYYLEASSLPAEVEAEERPLCAPLYDPADKRLLFSVTYFQRRINLEVHHALTDGTGASHFLKNLVAHYLVKRHPEELRGTAWPEYDASPTQKREDSFQKYYEPRRAAPRSGVRAHRLKGAMLPEYRMRAIEGVIPVKQALAAAKACNASLAAYFAAHWMLAIHHERPLRERGKPVVVTVPVNLRAFYPSETARNFFATMEVGYDFQDSEEFADVVASVAKEFQENLTPDRMAERMNQLISMETNWVSRFAPLALKDVVLRAAAKDDEKNHTISLSNMGKIDMPKPMRPYIHRFVVLIAARRMQSTLCTFGDQLTIGITSRFVSTEIPRRFFRQLTAAGLSVAIADNPLPGRDAL